MRDRNCFTSEAQLPRVSGHAAVVPNGWRYEWDQTSLAIPLSMNGGVDPPQRMLLHTYHNQSTQCLCGQH